MDLTSEQLSVVIEHAKRIAEAAHKGQTRRDKQTPYFRHVETVAESVEDRLKPIAYLHDVVEDTPITIEQLREVGFPEYIVTAVDLLTHRNSEPNIQYWGKIAKNKDAALVKIADIKANLQDTPNPKQKEKYEKGLSLFAQEGYVVD